MPLLRRTVNLKALQILLRQRPRSPIPTENHMPRLAFGHKRLVFGSQDLIVKGDESPPMLADTRPDNHLIIVSYCADVSAARLCNYKEDPLLALEIPISEPALAQEFRASDFKPDQVIRVVNDSHLVAFGISNSKPHVAEGVTGSGGILHEEVPIPSLDNAACEGYKAVGIYMQSSSVSKRPYS